MIRHLPTADPYLSGHGDPSYAVRHYDLDLTYTLEGNRLRGTATLTAEVLEETGRLVLDLAHLQADKVRITGAGLKKWSQRHHRLVLQARRRRRAGHRDHPRRRLRRAAAARDRQAPRRRGLGGA
ncbi:hypothetical protein [Nocardioides convexus]|uniref:hypothetical protein n=1 Tax=Nocardioides convexus TaxID=2712224 RepID=UPI0024188815|nr:hypothetical protein [Nocardioides convexus]